MEKETRGSLFFAAARRPWGFSPLSLPGTKVPKEGVWGSPARQLKLTVTEERIPLNFPDNREYMQTSTTLGVSIAFSSNPHCLGSS